MQKWVMTTLLSLMGTTLLALPVRNPAEPELLQKGVVWNCLCEPSPCCKAWCDIFSVRIGFEGDYVFNRHLEQKAAHRKVAHTELYNNAAYLALNVCDRVDFFTTLGGAYLHFLSPADPFSPVNFTGSSTLEIDCHTAFSWSVGARAILWQCGCFTLGAEGEYFSTRPTINSIVIEDNPSVYPNDFHVHYDEWQVGLGVAYRINPIVVPYLAVTWSAARGNFGNVTTTFSGRTNDHTVTLNDLENSRSIGYSVGFSFDVCDAFLFSAEWRFQDERALFINGQMRF